MNNEKQRVVITGMGVISTLGQTVGEFYQSLVNGKSGITKWKQPDARCYSQIGGDLSDFNFKDYLLAQQSTFSQQHLKLAKKLLRITSLPGVLSACAALQAYYDAGLNIQSPSSDRVAQVLGGHNLTNGYIANNVKVYNQDEPDYIDQ